MNIKIYHCLEGAQEAEGLVVVIDVFRASNTIIALLQSGVKYIIPVAELEKAYHLKMANPDHLLFGERGGLPPQGFDYGNSPANVSTMNLKGKKIILTTSAGSQGIVGAISAERVLIGSFLNAKAIIHYLKMHYSSNISLLAIGNEAVEPAVEDEECAKYLQSLLMGASHYLEPMVDKILQSDGAARLRRLSQEDDLKFCLKMNKSEIIPKFDLENGKIISV
jgi:2-phosphosulfolactate phosphatase